MSFTSVALVAAFFFTLLLPSSEGSFPLDETFLEVAATAARLSALAYETNLTEFSTGEGTWTHPDYDEFTAYTEEPDQALLAAVDGKCYVAFRGTNANLEDCKCCSHHDMCVLSCLETSQTLAVATNPPMLKFNAMLNIPTF